MNTAILVGIAFIVLGIIIFIVKLVMPNENQRMRRLGVASFVFGVILEIIGLVLSSGGIQIVITPTQNSPSSTPPVIPPTQMAIPVENGASWVAALGFVRVEGGTFTMGSNSGDNDEKPVHQVTISKAFYMGKHEVTQKEWVEVMGSNPSSFKGDSLPVERVSWYNVIEYCNKRSIKEGLTPAYTVDKGRADPSNTNDYDAVKWVVTWNRSANGYRLLTEAEWEYACRVGLTAPFNTGDTITTEQANYTGNYPYNNAAKGTNRGKTTAVGSFAANRWGLYDMHGNVWEWCWDWYDDYKSGAQTNPLGADSGSIRVARGGSWGSFARYLRSAYRDGHTPSHRDDGLGFRLVRP
jgi:formylglycine-generating enzyme required for sulfatase activity